MHATGGGFQRRVQGKRAVAVIFEAVALGAARRKGQDWIEPIQSLNGSLLIDAENRCMLRRFRYRPMMSAALLSKSGSSLAMYRSRRCGFTPASFQTRCTASLLTPSSAASLRQLQCVEPSFAFLRVDESIRARSFAVRIEAVCPGWLVSSPSMPEARKRCFQRMMVGAVVPRLF